MRFRRLLAASVLKLEVAMMCRRLFLVAAALLIARYSPAQTLSLTWDASPDTTVAGYRVYYGTESGVYPSQVDAGTNTSTIITGLAERGTYYFVVTAYTADGLESLPSNEVSYFVPFLGPATAPPSQPPTLDFLVNLTINENAWPQTVSLYGITSGSTNQSQSLMVTAMSSNPLLIADPTVNYSSPSTEGTLTFSPASDTYGRAGIYVTVNNGQSVSNTVTRAFRVIVIPTVAQLSLGSAVVAAGQQSSVPITFSSSAGITQFDALVNIPQNHLTNFSLQSLAPSVDPVSTAVSTASPTSLLLHFVASSGQAFFGTQEVAQLAFTALPDQTSAFVPLQVPPFSAVKIDGTVVTNRPAQSGRAVVVGNGTLLEAGFAADGSRVLTLYAQPATYAIEYTADLNDPVTWTALPYTISPLKLATLITGLDSSDVVFYRAVTLSSGP
jgi:hypothetical protein